MYVYNTDCLYSLAADYDDDDGNDVTVAGYVDVE